MPDVRKEILPAAGWLYNPFFDGEVQGVLERKRMVHAKVSKQVRTFLQAWPLIAFESSGELANEVSDIERHSAWLWCYKLDRQFSADLLAVITRFVELPKDKWKLRRALVEFENTAPDGFSEAVMHAETGDPTGQARFQENDGQVLWSPLIAWKEVAEYIEINCPHLKNVCLSGERLRKKEFYLEKERRAALLGRWKPNFAALERFGRSNWYERMPYLPG